jgi:TetR/AcrR family transcriptional regulator, cholesterol catabolism regulator
MARDGKKTAQVVREKAAEFFYTKGYDATTLREVAAASGVKVGSLYNHISSKEDLLHQVMGGIIDDLMGLLEGALKTPGDVVDVLAAVIDCHVRFHATRAQEAFIGNTSLRSLPEELRQVIVDKRNAYEKIIQDLIVQAGDEGLAEVLEPRLQTYTLVALGTNVASWYRPEGRLTLDEVVDTYTVIGLRQLGVKDARERVERQRDGRSIAV